VGYTGQGSPNRADALVWALTELFPALVAPPKAEEPAEHYAGDGGWMA
jgi:phage terminase large subunit-like protein